MPAEWEPQVAIWLSWPHNYLTWPGQFRPIPHMYAGIVAQISRFEEVRINCAAISEPVLEAEIFGNEATHKPGLIEHADGGTAFLNDVAELPTSLQVKLLRVLEDGAVRRIGSATPRPIDVRFIAATNKDLAAEVEAGRFRRDVYFRLAGASFTIPPLRNRKDEILPLAEQFVASAAGPLGRAFVLAEDAKAYLLAHDWPGNIRELRNACVAGTTASLP